MKFARPWTAAEVETAKRLYIDGMNIADIAVMLRRTAAAVKSQMCNARIKRAVRQEPTQPAAIERPIREVWAADEIAEAYERAGIRYVDIAKPQPDPRRFVSRARDSGCGNATAMCAEAWGAQ